ncbi:2,4-dienoyl-CoA reductase [Neobacillus sp. YX16]|uniref:2,4-dienoyl-CoA reductase n=1 Tax=Neobacillus sp. YX16 TaxID=3047874 RepID=UPI0024C24C24|nr:2,4-dienoyl-CoA reductase [Neobacillus sp. YX16]WHZ01017.1 2,4-dienoyl-CoA reductase [Neobacillus sp. YX16]
MKDQVVIITGGSSGMGKAMAKNFLEKGAHVVITGRNVERLEEASQSLERFGGKVLPIQMDVRDPEKVQLMVDETVKTFGRIDHLINNAAGNFICPAEDLSINGWNAVIDIVLNGTWYCSQAVGKHWINTQTKGSILNIVATYAWGAAAGVIHSACAKSGVLTMTRTLAVEWGEKYGIRANAIAPVPIENTGGADKLFGSNEALQRTIESVPLGRVGKPEEIAHLAAFLLSPNADYINGDCITMDGGQWLKHAHF